MSIVAAYGVVPQIISTQDELGNALTLLHRAERFDELPATASAILRAAGATVVVSALVRDGFSDLWHSVLLLDAEGGAAAGSLLPAEPAPFPGAGSAERGPLELVLGSVWGPEVCAALAAKLGVTDAVTVPIVDRGEPLAVLVGLTSNDPDTKLARIVLTHAAPAAGRFFSRRSLLPASMVLAPGEFSQRVEDELQRARRYGLEVAVLVCRPYGGATLRDLSERLAALVRRWDAVGVPDADLDELLLLLTETGRSGALGFLARLRSLGIAASLGAAVYPADGDEFAPLLAVASKRTCALLADAELIAESEPGRMIWVRGAPAGPGPDTAQCPRCATLYSARTSSDTGDVTPHARNAAANALDAVCPAHAVIIRVPVVEVLVGPRRSGLRHTPSPTPARSSWLRSQP
jgi:hypothetical protein